MDAIVIIVTLIVSVLSLVFSMYSLHKSNDKQDYLEQDKQYADLLKIALEMPDLRDVQMISKNVRAGENTFMTRYNIYAYLIWNCLETFYDLSCSKKMFSKEKSTIDKTWLPVILEENKIHYNWFKQNQRLFKEEFQNYINQLNDVVIRLAVISEFDEIYELMQKLFPIEELKRKPIIYDLLQKKKYILYIAENPLLSGQDNIIGFCFVYQIPEYKSLWIDYMAISPTYQNMGYGTLLFNKIASTGGEASNHIFVELEKPANNDPKSQQNRRLNFYKHQGVKILDVDYHLPTPEGSLPMFLGFKPGNAAHLLSNELLGSVIKEAISNIHGDLESMPKVLEKVVTNLKDIAL